MDAEGYVADGTAGALELSSQNYTDLSFERLIFSLLPTVFLIILSPFYLRHYRIQRVRVRAGRLLWLKLITAAGLFFVDLSSFRILRSTPSLQTDGSVLVSALSCIAALCVAFVVNAEHRRALQSSALTGIYLLITLLSDMARAKDYYMRTQAQMLFALAATSTVLKLMLLILLEFTKRRQIIDPEVRENISEEAVSGFWNRSFLLWLRSTLFLGFRTIISVADLGVLSPEFSSKVLSERLARSLRQSNKRSRYYLVKACMRTFYGEFFLVVLPRLCFIGFVLCQPLILQLVIDYIGQDGSSKLNSIGLIGAGLAVFFGIAASRSIFNHMNSRLVTMVRGAIIPLILKKTLVLSSGAANDSAALTLMSTDIEGVTAGIPILHELWACYIEIGLGLCLLSTVVEEAVSAAALLVAAASVLVFCVGLIFTTSSTAWNNSIEKRVSQMAKVLSQLKSIKMIGIEAAISTRLQNLRAAEMNAFKTFRQLAALMSLIAMAAYMSIQTTSIASGLYQSSFGGSLTPVSAFKTSAIVTLIAYPLMEVLLKHTWLKSTLACFGRLQTHLTLPDLDLQSVSSTSSGDNDAMGQNTQRSTEPQVAGLSIELISAYLAPSETAEPILNNVTCSLKPSQTTAIIGPVGTGKTTLLRSMMGEGAVHHGQARRKRATVAYCSQTPWLRNSTIRQNILGPLPYDPVFYEVVVNACALNEDLQALPNGDSTRVGINGSRLSGGQKHRIALARALYSRAEVILVDDIFGALDTVTAQDIHSRLFGPNGVLRRSASTIVFVTQSTTFVKSAHQAFILDGSGYITVHTQPSKLVLSSDLAARLEESSQATDTATQRVHSGQAGAIMALLEHDDPENIRQKGDMSLYRYFLGPTSTWKIALALLCMALVAASELLPDLFMRVWLESENVNDDYFTLYAAIGVATCLVTFCTMWYWFVVLVPQNALKLHKKMLDSVIGAKLYFVLSSDLGSILNRFSQDITLLTLDLPKALYRVVYLGTHVLLSTAVIISGIQHSTVVVPFLVVTLYGIQFYYLRTSRQLRHLETEANTPLYTLFAEMATGLEHIRAFHWQTNIVEEGIAALDFSQRPYYYKLATQRWVELAMDFTNLGLALILVSVTTSSSEPTSQSAVGLSMLSLVTFSTKLNLAAGAWVSLETGLAGVARLRAFIYGTPPEERETETVLPPRWPNAGNIVFSDVTSQYNPNDRTTVLNDVSVTFHAGQKIGISGRSGSGKTSLLLTILRLMEYTGTIVIDGIDISTISAQQLRSRITTISQDTIKLDGSIRENLLAYDGQIEDETITDDIIFEALDQAELTTVVESRGGLDVPLSTMDLSEGQMQLLSLARAIVHNTCTQSRVVLLDEPTSNLDFDTDNRIQSAIRDAFLDCTILIVSHRLETQWDADACFEVRNKGVYRIAVPKMPARPPDQNW